MSDIEFMARRKAWLALRSELERAQEEIDLCAATHLRGEGNAPSRRALERVDDLLAEVHEARCEVDRLILERAE